MYIVRESIGLHPRIHSINDATTIHARNEDHTKWYAKYIFGLICNLFKLKHPTVWIWCKNYNTLVLVLQSDKNECKARNQSFLYIRTEQLLWVIPICSVYWVRYCIREFLLDTKDFLDQIINFGAKILELQIKHSKIDYLCKFEKK